MRISLLLTLLFVSTMSFAQTVKELVQRGDQFYGKKDYKKALEAFLQALDQNPDDAAVNLKVGMSYLYSETKSKAARFIDKAYRLNPNINDEINYHLGVAFQNTNEFKKAIEQFEQFKKKRKNLAEIADKKSRSAA
ncbi:MAG: tetratricopeptide repeat protein [Bacteroidia bacterium]|nr:tetratricopeptide repeat protein [Bacteroidia bacterium]